MFFEGWGLQGVVGIMEWFKVHRVNRKPLHDSKYVFRNSEGACMYPYADTGIEVYNFKRAKKTNY